MILGVISERKNVSPLLDNLSEADFTDVSVVMKDIKARNELIDDMGPLKGVKPEDLLTALHKKGVAKKMAKLYVDAVEKNKILVAIETEKSAESAVLEMLQIQNAEQIKVL